MALFVDIEKRMGTFRLRAKLEAADEVTAVLGKSGAGKSMLLKCIAGIEAPDQGRIVLKDQVLFDSAKKINVPAGKRKIGYLFQDYALFPNMTVMQNIMCAARNKERAAKLVKQFFLEGKEGLYPWQLSGGQKQRTAMARMLAMEPQMIMLDEPFSALDQHLSWQLEQEMAKLLQAYKGTVLWVSHDRHEVFRMSQSIAIIEEGSLEQIQEKNQFFMHPRTLSAALLGGCENVSKLKKIGSGRYYAEDWALVLETEACSFEPRYAGYRAGDFVITDQMEPVNVMECQVVSAIEDLQTMHIMVQPKKSRLERTSAVIKCELPKERWQQFNQERLLIKLEKEALILLEK